MPQKAAKIAAVCKRECLAYFYSPIFYVAAVFVTFILGMTLNFYVQSMQGMEANLEYVVRGGGALLLIIAPMLTMRAFAEEFKQGTVEPLMTAPLTDWEVVLGKYFAAVLVMAALFVPSLVHTAIFYTVGDARPDTLQTLIFYGVLLVWAAFYAALGLFASVVTRDQVVAAIVAFAINIFFFAVGSWLGDTDFVKNHEGLKAAVDYVNVYTHLDTALRCIIDTRDVVYFASVIIFLLFVTVRMLESRKWRG